MNAKETEDKIRERNEHNRPIARKASWISDVFQEYPLTADDKAKILRKLRWKFKKEQMKVA